MALWQYKLAMLVVFSIGLCVANRLAGVCCESAFAKESLLPTGNLRCDCCTSKLRVSVEATDPMPAFSLRSSRRAAMKASGIYAGIPGVTTGQGYTAYALVEDPSLSSSMMSRALFLFRSRSGSWVVGPVLGRRPWLISATGEGADTPFEVPATRDWRLWEHGRESSVTKQRLQARLRVHVTCLLPKTPAPTPAKSNTKWATTPQPPLKAWNTSQRGKAQQGAGPAMLSATIETTSPAPGPSSMSSPPPSLPPKLATTTTSKIMHIEPVCRHIELRIRGLEGRPDHDRLREFTGLYTLFSVDNHFNLRYHHLSDEATRTTSLGALQTFDLYFNHVMGAWAVGSHLRPNIIGHEMNAKVEMAIKSTVMRPQQLGVRRWTYLRGGGFGPVVMVRCVNVTSTNQMSSPGLTIQLVVAAMLDHVASDSIRNAIAAALDKPKRTVHIIRMSATYTPQRGMDATLVTATIDSAHKGDSVGVLASSTLFPLLVQHSVHTPVWNPSLTTTQQVNAKREVLITSTHFVLVVSVVVAGLVVTFSSSQDDMQTNLKRESQDCFCVEEEAKTLLHPQRLQEMKAIVEWNNAIHDVDV